MNEKIFSISNEEEFIEIALKVFIYQYENVPIYRKFCDLLGRDVKKIRDLKEIPFLPIELFKSETILDQLLDNNPSKSTDFDIVFSSSGTTGQIQSKHYVRSLSLYENSFLKTYQIFYGAPKDFVILALLPSYLQRDGSSLIYMVQKLINLGNQPESGFYLDDLTGLHNKIAQLEKQGRKTLLIGVTYALLDFIEKFPNSVFSNLTVMETGGMKGRRKEMIREELHNRLGKNLGSSAIHSEYGMTELLSQAYSSGEGIFKCPPWMHVLIREMQDPRTFLPCQRTGGLNIIDLANYHSCSFLATQDLGKMHSDGSFEVLGRFDYSDIRGCNLLVQ